MPVFQYTAMDSAGKEKKGKIDAANENAAASALKDQGLFPTGIKEVKAGGGAKGPAKAQKGDGKKKGGLSMDIQLGTPKIARKDLTIMTRQLAILLDAGLPLIRSLRTLEKQAKNKAVKKILGETADSVEGGSTFSEALAQNPKSFSKLYLNMVRAGEAAGAMENILNRLAEFLEKAAKMASKVKSAMVYPVVVLFIAVTITSGLMLFIVPKFAKIFTDLLEGAPLPALTQFVMSISTFMQQRAYIGVIFIVVFIILYKLAKKTKIGAAVIDWSFFKAPLIGPIISKSAISRFARTLSTLMGAGVPVLNALQIVRDTAGNGVVVGGVQKIHDAVKEGEGMAGPLNATKIFPDMVVSMVEVGEETGKLPEMLEKIADNYDEEVDNAVDALTSMIEPLMICFLAVVIGGIVIALFMPLIEIVKKLGG